MKSSLIGKIKSDFVKIFHIIFPILLFATGIMIVYFMLTNEQRIELYLLAVAYYVPPAGKESIIPLATGIGIHPLMITLVITVNDVLISLFIIWNHTYLKKVPIIGKGLIIAEKKGRKIAKKYSHADYKEYDNHAHWIMNEPGWEKIAQDIYEWIKKKIY